MNVMFTTMQRQDVANRLLAAARGADGITAGAVIGAAAAGALDPLSGIDLRFATDGEIADVRERWTALMYAEFGAVHHTVEAEGTVYLLQDLLTARIAIVSPARFGPRPGEPFHPVFGADVQQGGIGAPAADLVGPAWLAALRTRAALHRGDGPAAADALGGLRDALIALAGARTGAPPGFLVPEDRTRLRATETGSRDVKNVGRAFAAAVQILDAELQSAAPAVADAVTLPLLEEVAG
ncbi:hypothetical protein AXK56_02280 [Tsukamurella pulmonis]|uniref:Nucleotidyltransferase domain-containing protein n=2 Tax=Tsukamurella pulmonis TaxID=47312 RepID=A0A1H1EGB5_9ACTN|nr:hypothetical protein AXK56_02280 [Tsukamurella pulmonis]SDQ87509.1 hypothetical protein SAMN04489765_2181 [Tsukamurella pulmonis]SUP20942.1 Uncharacterised protein [Tsukamurella pulmonis]